MDTLVVGSATTTTTTTTTNYKYKAGVLLLYFYFYVEDWRKLTIGHLFYGLNRTIVDVRICR